jgi:hypothetical protein
MHGGNPDTEIKRMTSYKLVSCEHYIINNDNVLFTTAGIKYFSPYFKKLGIDIRTVNTISKLIFAKRKIRHLLIEEIEHELVALPQTLERRWLTSFLQSDMREFERLGRLIERRNITLIRSID